jgi:tRNA (guanine-N(7)-)-methyltransferase subunit TRM82
MLQHLPKKSQSDALAKRFDRRKSLTGFSLAFTMRHPFQCVAACHPKERLAGILVAACASELFVVCLETKSILSKWSSQSAQTETLEAPAADEPPGKKRKLEESKSKLPKIIKLVCTADANHVIAVTEDKYIRVFKLHSDRGQLEELSKR